MENNKAIKSVKEETDNKQEMTKKKQKQIDIKKNDEFISQFKKEENQKLMDIQMINLDIDDIKNMNSFSPYFDFNNNNIINQFDIKNFNNKINMNSYSPRLNFNNINNLNEFNIHNFNSIKQCFSLPPLIGLSNIGGTSYMNASLQCFSQIEELTNYFKFNPEINQIINHNPNSLASSFKNVINNLWPLNNNKGNKVFTPYEFKEKISSINFFGDGDPKNIIEFIIMTLNEELNKKKNNFNSRNYNLDSTNEQIVLKDFERYFKDSYRSIISDLFIGTNESIYICSNCSTNRYSFEMFFFLIFPLEEVRKYTLLKMKQLNKNIVDIQDCFEYDKKIEIFSGDNSMYCDICKKCTNRSMQTVLYTLPKILIIILNRGLGMQFKLEFGENLNLNNYAKNDGGVYELICVLSHFGESRMNGHFIATCKSPIDNR